MHCLSVTTLLVVVASQFVSGFLTFNLNHLLSEHHLSRLQLANVEENWIEQPLDHFNVNDKRTLKMRYYETLDIWEKNGPIYIFIGGEIALNAYWALPDDLSLSGQMTLETNGALFATEHRYYGYSKPEIPRNNLTEYYQFLNSEQAIQDLVYFIKMLKTNPKFAESKVVVIGGSYAGNLAVWLRELHPELVDAAVACSAPVLAKKDFHEYLDVVRHTIDKYGTPNCSSKLDHAFRETEKLLKTKDGIETLKKKYGICPENDLTVLENQQLFFTIRYYHWCNAVQNAAKSSDIQSRCESIGADMLKPDISNAFTTGLYYDEALGCRNVDLNIVKKLFTDPWTYQYCTEFGYLITTSSEKQPFVHWTPVEFRLKWCTSLINGDVEKTVDEGIARTNKMYGGRTPKVSKVVFTHGDMDPWSSLGVLQDLGPDAPVVIVNGSSHCGALLVRPNEPEELDKIRENIRNLIYKWISIA